MSTDVWLAEMGAGGLRAEKLGVFSKPERAQEVCQDNADEYFGKARTPPLSWLQSRDSKGHYTQDHFSASHICPGRGTFLFQVTRYTIDEVCQP